MSRARPSERDILEARFLALAEARVMSQADYEAEMLDLQRRLDRVETPRLRSRMREEGAPEPWENLAAEGAAPCEDDEAAGEQFVEAAGAAQWKARALKVTAFAVGALRMVCAGGEARPKLRALVALLAFGAEGTPSMRELAEVYSLTPERVSQLVEEMQQRFSLPKNHNNKSAAAVESYRAVANLRGKSA